MRTIYYLLATIMLISCSTNTNDLEKLKLKEIRNATISLASATETTDSLDNRRYIPQEHIHLMVDNWNNPKDVELNKFLPTYKINIELKGGEVRSFRLSPGVIKEKNDYSVILKEYYLGEKLWNLSYKP